MAPCTYYSAVSPPTSVSSSGNSKVKHSFNSLFFAILKYATSYLFVYAFAFYFKSCWFVQEPSSNVPQRKVLLIFYCIPVSPGKSRLIFTFPRNFGVWIDKIIPRWVFHLGQNLVLDSDLYLLHIEVIAWLLK